jgi:2-iminobutanoate/2-iminopropanoate deaminase
MSAMLKRINVENVARLKFFSHAVIAGDFIFVSGTLGMKPGKLELVEGGIVPETRQTLRNIETILAAAGAALSDIVKVTVYLADESTFAQMNETYESVMGTEAPPARITVGKVGLAFGAALEIECVAYRSAR